MEKARTADDTEIRMSGIEALNKALGPATALRFLTLLHRSGAAAIDLKERKPEKRQFHTPEFDPSLRFIER